MTPANPPPTVRCSCGAETILDHCPFCGSQSLSPSRCRPMNATAAAASTVADLAPRAWELLTNRGYASRAARRIIQRRLRAAGYRFYIALPDEGPARWGILSPGAGIPRPEDEFYYVGVSLNHCAHQMGNDNAAIGWKDFWNWD